MIGWNSVEAELMSYALFVFSLHCNKCPWRSQESVLRPKCQSGNILKWIMHVNCCTISLNFQCLQWEMFESTHASPWSHWCTATSDEMSPLLRGPITKISQSECFIAGLSHVINLLLTKLDWNRSGRISALVFFCSVLTAFEPYCQDLGPIFSQYSSHTSLG